jgi:hypothetical protein
MKKLFYLIFSLGSIVGQDKFVGFGAARSGSTYVGWASYGTKLKGNTNSYSTTEFTDTASSVRTGILQVFFQQSRITVAALGDIGVAAGNGSTLSSFSGGILTAFNVSSKNIKLPGTNLVFILRPTKTLGVHTEYQFGIGRIF